MQHVRVGIQLNDAKLFQLAEKAADTRQSVGRDRRIFMIGVEIDVLHPGQVYLH